jgi:hypothetical protein
MRLETELQHQAIIWSDIGQGKPICHITRQVDELEVKFEDRNAFFLSFFWTTPLSCLDFHAESCHVYCLVLVLGQ